VTRTHIRIGDRRIGPNEPCYIIAEAGINHNGDLGVAKALVDAAIAAGADAVKFQKRKLSEVYQEAILAEPRLGEQALQYLVPILVEFELADTEFVDLQNYCTQQGITFLCTPWDTHSVDFLERLGVPAYKIGSPDMTNVLLLDHVARTQKPVIVSTGMSTEEEIRKTIAFLAERDAECALLHCVSTYPAAPEEINLRFMRALHEWSGWPVGYSGHDPGIAISLAAVALGANILERHLTLDRSLRGPDHSSSLTPDDLASQVAAVREVETSLGVPHRWMTRGEILNRRVLGKSLVARVDIPADTVITSAMVTSKSPGMGLSPQYVNDLVGRRLGRAVRRDDPFTEDDLEDVLGPVTSKPIEVGTRWGIVARFTDIDDLLVRFERDGLSFIEFHVSDRDLDVGVDGFNRRQFPHEMVVHAPEYCHDSLIDLCASDDGQRDMSISRIQKTIDLARDMAPHFHPSTRGPKIVVHVGGMAPRPEHYDHQGARGRLLDSIDRLDHVGVDLLLENLPPFPWYFGGKWFGHVLVDTNDTVELCEQSGLGLCFDVSHAALACNRSGESLVQFAASVTRYVRHLHVSDAAGTGGEGLQIGEGDVNFIEVMPVLLTARPTLVPEIWMGHHMGGRGFRLGLDRLTELVWASQVLTGGTGDERHTPLEGLVVSSSGTVLTALQAIDRNRLGIAFVVDDSRVVVGVVTDGDIRHTIVRGGNLHTPIAAVMNRSFSFARSTDESDFMRARLPGRTRIMPVLDAHGRLVDYASDYHSPRAS
jgi:sialic acid synthase SpsE/sugar phosphate isomerase/epimerase